MSFRQAVIWLFFFLGLHQLSWAQDSVTSKTYEKLTEIQEQIGANELDPAYAGLVELLGNVKEGSIDEALTLQTIGYVEMGRENFPEAIDYLKRSLATEKLPQNVVYNVGYMVAQLHAALNQYDEALIFAEGWFTQLEAPTSAQFIFMANIYAQTKRYAESVPYALKAIENSDEPKENWYQLLTASYFELNRMKEAADTLQVMVNNWPEKASYWEQLASVLVILEDEASALAVLKIAFNEELLEKETTVKSLVQLAIARGIPEQGARFIEEGFNRGVLPEDPDYLKMLAMSLARAKERPAAIEAYKRLAIKEESNESWIDISNLYVEMGEWDEAENALLRALKGDLKSPGKAWLLLGIAQAEQQKFEDARTSLQKSIAFEETEKPATQWLNYTEDMKRQADWVAEYKDT